MSDKIYPDWISDRLTTEEEGEEFLSYENKGIYYRHIDYVKEGDVWCIHPSDEKNQNEKYLKFVATPSECLARSQANGEPYTDSTTKSAEGVEVKADFGVSFDPYEKIKELEQALAESEERVQEYKGFFEEQINENIELKKFLVKEWVSKMRVLE